MHQEALILANGRIFTACDNMPNAQAVGILGDRIACVGSSEEVRVQMPQGCRQINLDGRMVIPGLIDAHAHLMWYGGALFRWADLTGTRSIAEIQQRLREHDAKMQQIGGSACAWILGIRFDHEILAEKRFPTRQELDAVCQDRPIMITRLCGHALVVNSKALEIAGIRSESGLLTENDADPIWEKMPAFSPEELHEVARLVTQKGLSAGLTSVHCLLTEPDEVKALVTLNQQGDLKQRLRLQIGYHMLEAAKGLGVVTGFGNSMLRLGSLKMFADGSMGARTAALTAPYDDDPSTTGVLIHSHEEIVEQAKRGHEAGFQLAIHAIGDLAIDHSLDALEAALASDGSTGAQRRHRIEHASIIRPDQIDRMARLGVIACVQPQFINTDFWTSERVGSKRRAWVYPFKSMMEKGIHLAGGSDCPVEELNPFQGIQRAVLRDEETISERFTVEEAIRLYTLGGAYAGFEEHLKGSIEPGKLADLLVLPCDLRDMDPTQIENVRPERVFVGGKQVLGEA